MMNLESSTECCGGELYALDVEDLKKVRVTVEEEVMFVSACNLGGYTC